MNRIIQYTLILLVLTIIGGSVWYFRSTASTKVNSSQETKLTDGLVGYWTFDGNHMDWNQSTAEARDQAGNNNGDVIGASPTTGKINQALSFNGSSDNVKLGDIDVDGAMTISAWIKTDPTYSGTNQIFAKNYTTYQLYISATTNKFNMQTNSGTGCNSSSIGTITPGEWHHITVTWSTNTGSTYYIDGNFDKVVGGSCANEITDSDLVTRIGSHTWGTSNYFMGQIDEVRLYNQELSANEVVELYNQGQVKINASQETKLTDGLILYQSFDGNHMDWSQSTAEARDQSGTNHGNVVGPIAATGKIGQAIEFDGSNDYVDFGNSFNVIDNNTISFWLKVRNLPVGGSYPYGTIIGDGSYNWHFQILGPTGNIGLRKWGSPFQAMTSTATLDLNRWYYITLTLTSNPSTSFDSGNRNAKIYIDGILDKEQAFRTPFSTGGNTRMSYRVQGDITWIDGYVDELRIYDRAISADEVWQLYRQGSAKINSSQETKLTDGLVGNWTFDGNHMDWAQSTTEARDQSGSDAHGNVDGSTATIGKIGQSLNFDGNDDVTVSEDADLNFGTGDYSWGAWIKTSSSSRQNIITLGSNPYTYIDINSGVTNRIISRIYSSGADAFATTDSFTITDEIWHHIFVTLDRNGNAQIYVDGVAGTMINTDISSTSAVNLTGNLYIGAYAGSSYYFNG
ncbi:LamG domain-containing protein, partial [Patescibacteria group bacterium]